MFLRFVSVLMLFRLGTTGESRLEYANARGKFRKDFDFTFEFKTTAEEGILFYAADKNNDHFVSVFLKHAHVIFD